MKYKISYLVAPLFFILSLNVSAEYKTTGFTDEEYQKVAKSSGEYRECLNKTAIEQIEVQNDARAIADYAMKNCASILEGLNEYLISANYAPEAIKRLLGGTADQAANKLLRNLMRTMATRKP